MVKHFLALSVILLLCGCASSKKIITSGLSTQSPLVTGSVVNPSAFEKGGTLALISFKPGTGAAADEETDQLSLMMVKGIKDTLPGLSTHFTLPSGDQENPDLNLDGHIQNYGHDVRLPRLKLNKNQVYLSVDGEIWLRETGEKIFTFQTSTVIDLKTQDYRAAAYQVGGAIARFIAAQSS